MTSSVAADGVATEDPCADGAGEDGLPEGEGRSSRLLVVGIVLLVLCFVGRVFVAQPVVVHGDSMAPTLADGAVLVVDRLSYRFTEPAVGDVVVAAVPEQGEVVKRVVAVAGDSVGLEDGVLVRNGALVAEPYIDPTQMKGTYWGPIVVPDGQVFLLGDHRFTSLDSRHYGPVSIDAIEGRVRLHLWG